MSFVPSQSLTKLICANCKKYLSHFPIYLHPNEGSFCGRCPKPDEPNTARNEIYESIALTQKFPCCYSSNGCTENLTPHKIPQHEKHCPFMKCDCPAFVSTSCKWRGFTKDLHDHFSEKHPTYFLADGQFELDFISSYIENCLLPFGEDIFIVCRTNDTKANIFSCTVSYLGSNPLANDYVYKLILENERKSHAHVISKKLNDKADIVVDGIRDVLNNPSSIIATIQILEHAETIEDNGNEEDDENGLVDYELMKELECTVCFEYMLPPIYQCLTGHSLCLTCKTSVESCPTCREEFKNTQNFTLAQVINHLTYPCKNKRCKFTTKAKDIRKHEATCIFGPVKCPLEEYEDCYEEIIFSDIYDHIMNCHSENLLEIETVYVPFELGQDQDDEDCYILKHGFRLFKLHYKYQEREFFWAMQLIGPAEESGKYKFEIDILDNSGRNQRVYFKSICSPLSNKNDAFNEDKYYIYIHYSQIQSMITQDFTYRVRILQE